MTKPSMQASTLLDLVPLKTAYKDLSENPTYQRRFHVMAKPGGAKCNIDCQYCFYLHKENLLHQPKQPKMDDETLEAFVKSYIESQDGDEIVFSWQGGEPTLLGLDYFRKIVELQKNISLRALRLKTICRLMAFCSTTNGVSSWPKTIFWLGYPSMVRKRSTTNIVSLAAENLPFIW